MGMNLVLDYTQLHPSSVGLSKPSLLDSSLLRFAGLSQKENRQLEFYLYQQEGLWVTLVSLFLCTALKLGGGPGIRVI